MWCVTQVNLSQRINIFFYYFASKENEKQNKIEKKNKNQLSMRSRFVIETSFDFLMC